MVSLHTCTGTNKHSTDQDGTLQEEKGVPGGTGGLVNLTLQTTILLDFMMK